MCIISFSQNLANKNKMITNKNNPPIILVDGSSYLYRAFYAPPHFQTRDGLPTGAIFGITKMLLSIKENYKPKYMAVIFDAKGKNFRHDLYPEYKANRPSMPKELQAQVPYIYDLVKGLGFNLISIENVEADDVIGTLATKISKTHNNILISTGDKDFAQLINADITLIDTMKNEIIDRNSVVSKYSLPPSKIIDYLALMGDKSDNIPGVSGIGAKTAQTLLQAYTLKELLDNPKIVLDIPVRGAKSIATKIQNRKEIELSYKLATINTNLDLDQGLDDIKIKPTDFKVLQEIYTKCEFQMFLKELMIESNTFDNSSFLENIFTITKESELNEVLDLIKKENHFSLGVQTQTLQRDNKEIVGLSLAFLDKAYYLPLKHEYKNITEQVDFSKAKAKLQEILKNKKIIKVFQNTKEDLRILKANDFLIENYADTMLLSYVINSNGNHSLTNLSVLYLHHNPINFDDLLKTIEGDKLFSKVNIENASVYGAEKAKINLLLFKKFIKVLEEKPTLLKLYQEIEKPLMPVIALMEENGVILDTDKLKIQSDDLDKRIKKLEFAIHECAKEEFNLNSTKQMQYILYDKLQLPVMKKTPTNKPSTAEDALSLLAKDFNIVKDILEYRSLTKLKSTYVDALPKLVNKNTNKIHASFNQATTVTGRLSCSNPNLQNIPIRTEEGRKIRQSFIASKGYKIVAFDYSQIELRLMAFFSRDKNLLGSFKKNQDIHAQTAANVFSCKENEITKEQRSFAKAINFGIIYGISAYGLANQIKVNQATAKQYIENYFKKYPKILDYIENTKQKAFDEGFVETLFGRRVYLPQINASKINIRRQAQRMAINAPMQGSAADIIKIAMMKIDDFIKTSTLDIKMLIQVHDELVFAIKDEDVDKASASIKEIMESVCKNDIDVPLTVDYGVGNNWDEAH